MATDTQIRTALKRTRRAIELRPSIARGTMKTTTRLEDGLKCVSGNDDWTFEMDDPSSIGGEGGAPSPGIYGLGALGGCVAMSVKLQAAESSVPIRSVAVAIEADYDDHGMFRMNGVSPGFLEFRLNIDVDSTAPADSVRELVAQALEISGWLNVFTHGQKIVTAVSVNANAKTTVD